MSAIDLFICTIISYDSIDYEFQYFADSTHSNYYECAR